MKKLDDTKKMKQSVKLFKSTLRKFCDYCDKDGGGRTYLKGVNIECKAGTVKLRATNGHIAVRKIMPDLFPEWADIEKYKFNVTVKDIKAMYHLLPWNATISCDGESLIIGYTNSDQKIVMQLDRLEPIEYPDLDTRIDMCKKQNKEFGNVEFGLNPNLIRDLKCIGENYTDLCVFSVMTTKPMLDAIHISVGDNVECAVMPLRI